MKDGDSPQRWLGFYRRIQIALEVRDRNERRRVGCLRFVSDCEIVWLVGSFDREQTALDLQTFGHFQYARNVLAREQHRARAAGLVHGEVTIERARSAIVAEIS